MVIRTKQMTAWETIRSPVPMWTMPSKLDSFWMLCSQRFKREIWWGSGNNFNSGLTFMATRRIFCYAITIVWNNHILLHLIKLSLLCIITTYCFPSLPTLHQISLIFFIMQYSRQLYCLNCVQKLKSCPTICFIVPSDVRDTELADFKIASSGKTGTSTTCPN